MDDLMECLYEFVTENRMAALEADRGYKGSTLSIVRKEKRLEECLDQEQRKELDQLIAEVYRQNAIEREYLFQAALGLARELNALVRA